MTNSSADASGPSAARATPAESAITRVSSRDIPLTISLSEPLREDADTELGDVVEDRSAVSPFDAAAASLLSGEVAKMLGTLDEREREILRLRFGLDHGEPRTLEEVGQRFHLTRERIRQIEAKAMSKLRHPSVDFGLRECLAEGSPEARRNERLSRPR